MGKHSSEEPTLEITDGEKKRYEERARKWLLELRPNIDPESLEAFALMGTLVNLQISQEKLIEEGGVPLSVARQAIGDFTTQAGTLLQGLRAKSK